MPRSDTAGPYDSIRLAVLEAAQGDPGSESFHALGVMSVLDGKLSDAVGYLTRAAEGDGSDASIELDLGAALLENSKEADAISEISSIGIADPGEAASSGRTLQGYGESLGHLDRALKEDPKSREALFDKALCLEAMHVSGQAKKAWGAYLETDAISGWAVEARRHLQGIDNTDRAPSPSGRELVNQFVDAAERGDDDRAWLLHTKDREALTGRFIPDELVDSYVQSLDAGSRGDARRVRRAMEYLGALDYARSGDKFCSCLAQVLHRTASPQYSRIAEGRKLIHSGHQSFLQADYKRAQEAYSEAVTSFRAAGDDPDAMWAEYWAGFATLQTKDLSRSREVLTNLANTAKQNGYRWLYGQALLAQASLEEDNNRYSEALEDLRLSVDELSAVGDNVGKQRALTHKGDLYEKLGDHLAALGSIGESLDLEDVSPAGIRQTWRTCHGAGNTLAALGLYSAATQFHEEALSLSHSQSPGDPAMVYLSCLELAMDLGNEGEFSSAASLVAQAEDVASSRSSQASGAAMLAFCALKRGEINLLSKDYGKAIECFDRSIKIFGHLKFDTVICEAHKGLVRSYYATGEANELARELDAVLDLFERYRANILEDTNRDSYFAIQQEIYDLAIDFAYSVGHDAQKAFEYSETSKARSLLSLLATTPTGEAENAGAPIRPAGAPVFSLDQIKRQLPAQAQVVEYAVLEQHLLIWVLSNDDFSWRLVEVSSRSLSEKVKQYRELLLKGDDANEEVLDDLSKELYQLLIWPIESSLVTDKQLFIVTDKFLAGLPFAALRSPASREYLVSQIGLPELAPSSMALIRCFQVAALRRAKSGEETFLGVANPVFDRTKYRELAPLGDTVREVSEISRLYPSHHVISGSAAVRDAVEAGMCNADVIELATHYIVDPGSPESSRLLLAAPWIRGNEDSAAESSLSAREVYGLKLERARLVILSACESGVEGASNDEVLVGMSRAFLAAGVPIVVASLWPVDSSVTADLMIAFHRYRKLKRLTTCEALRQAELDMINGSDSRLQRARYWAAFTVVGGYAEF